MTHIRSILRFWAILLIISVSVPAVSGAVSICVMAGGSCPLTGTHEFSLFKSGTDTCCPDAIKGAEADAFENSIPIIAPGILNGADCHPKEHPQSNSTPDSHCGSCSDCSLESAADYFGAALTSIVVSQLKFDISAVATSEITMPDKSTPESWLVSRDWIISIPTSPLYKKYQAYLN